MSSKVGIIIRREYMERVKKKSFIITTLLMPILMLAMMVIPVLIAEFSEGDTRNIYVVDESGIIADSMQSTPNLKIKKCAGDWQQKLTDEEADAVLIIPANVKDENEPMQLITAGPSSISLETELTSQINSIIESQRLEEFHIDNLEEIMQAVHSDVGMRSRQFEAEGESSTLLSYMLGVALTLILYMCLLIYGQMVMTSIIEEKTNRVLEIVVSSVKPTQLMLGKITGIGLVAITQILIWTVLIAGMSAFLLPAIMPAEMASDMATLNAGGALTNLSTDVDTLQALAMLSDVGYILRLFGLLLLFLVGGFMLYSAIYAAIGSAVDNIQDAGQMQSIIIFPIIIGIVFGMTAASDPSSTLSVWMSMIPFTSPMVMMARIPYELPVWQIALSLVILYASFFFMVWFAGKIYRVGIFMYGKKPSFKELIRWARYK